MWSVLQYLVLYTIHQPQYIVVSNGAMNMCILHKYLNHDILCYKATIPTIYSRATRSARSAVSRAVYTLCGKLHHYTTNCEIKQISCRSAQLVIMCAQRSTKRTAQLALTNCAARTKRTARSATYSAYKAHSILYKYAQIYCVYFSCSNACILVLYAVQYTHTASVKAAVCVLCKFNIIVKKEL